MSNGYTKGPWKFSVDHGFSGFWGPNCEMLLYYTTSDDGLHCLNPADACLISAAPDLLAALEHVIHVIEKSENWWIDCPDRGGFDAELIRAAIAKARGADFAPRSDDVGQNDA